MPQHRTATASVRSSLRRAASAAVESLESRRLLANSVWAYPGLDGHMLYKPQPLGDKIEDFSNVGYQGGTVSIPDVPTRVTVGAPSGGDDTAIIQAAINQVQALPLDAAGFRGAVQLSAGTYRIDGSLNITASGVVLRGAGPNKTLLHATTVTDTSERTVINVNGSGTRSTVSGSTHTIIDKYVPVGAVSFAVDSTANLHVGDAVIVHRPSTQQWINDLGMNLLTMPWTPGSKDTDMDRTITHIDGARVTIDAPITQALDVRYTDASRGNNTIYAYTAAGRLNNVAVEDLGGYSDYDPSVVDASNNAIDENHPWVFINVDGSQNAWVRDVSARYFGYAAVYVTGNSRWVTVQDSEMIDYVSQITGGRRYGFNLDDSCNCLFRNCYTRQGRHDYVEGSGVDGPNVFVDDRADQTHADAGPHHRYSTAALWDNLTVGQLNIQNRGNLGSGHGWAGANQVIWNSTAGSFVVQNPPAAQNWLIGSIGTIANGTVYVGPHDPGIYDLSGPSGTGTNVATRSLYYQQLAERDGNENFAMRESRLGDADGFVNDGAVDNVPVDATWRTNIQNATGRTGVGFDTIGLGALVPFTFNYAIDPGTYVVSASLSLGAKNTGGTSAGDRIYFEDKSRSYSWADLGLSAPTTTAGGLTIDLTPILPALQDGRLNVAILGNTAVDWATLNFNTASTTQPTTLTLGAAADAYVRDGTSAATNFGTAASLQTKLDATNNQQESYLKFDLSSLAGQVTSATLRLVPTTVGYGATTFGNGTGAIFNQLSLVSDDSWTETGINWNNRPSSAAVSQTFISKLNAPLLIDLTSLVRGELGGNEQLSLRLNSIVNSASGQINFASRENGTVSLRPQLIITTYNNALSPVADAYVRSGTFAGSNFGTATDLAVKKDSSATSDNNRDAYLKFDLTGVGAAPASAALRLMPMSAGAPAAAGTVDLVGDDTWTETGITWTNKPAAGAVLGTWPVMQATPGKALLTSQVASTIAGDRLLSLHVGSSAVSSGVSDYASREYADGSLRPMLVFSSLKPTITDIGNVQGALSTPTQPTWFGVWDAETPAGSLNVTATSSNTALLPNANIAFSGSGGDRTVTLTPAAGQTGASIVTIIVQDAQGQVVQTQFQYSVNNSLSINGDQQTAGQADTIRVVRNGSFVDVLRNNESTPVVHADYATAPLLNIDGLGGTDNVILDLSGGNPIPTGGITIDGDTGNDVVSVVGSSGSDAVTLSNGQILVGGLAATLTSVEELDVNLGAGADTLAANGNASVNTGLFVLNVSGGGSVAMTAGSMLPNFADVNVNGATFDLAGQSQTIDQLAGTGTVTDNGAAATLTVGQSNGSSTFAGTLTDGSGALSLTKVGTGKLTLSGVNSYTGASTIGGGTIEAGASASFVGLIGQVFFNGGTLHVTGNSTAANVVNKFSTCLVAGGTGTFDIDAGVTLTIGGSLASLQTNRSGGPHGGKFSKLGAGTLRILSNNGQLDDPFALGAGTVIAESATALGGADNSSNHVDMKNGTTLVLRQDSATNFLTPVNIVDAAAIVNVMIDRQTAGAGVADSLNALTSAGAFTMILSAGANVTNGVQSLNVGSVTLGGAGVFDVGAGTALNVTGAVGGAFGLTKSGTGEMLLAGTNTYTGATTVAGGTLRVDGSILSSNSGVSVGSGATFIAGATQELTSLSINSGGLAMIAAGPDKLLTVSALTLAGTGELDLTDNDLVIDYAAGFSPLATIRGYVASAFQGGGWTGSGITSSSAAAAATASGATRTAVGLAEASDVFSTFPATFDGRSIDASSLLLRYTAAGDANLDGTVDLTDFTFLASNFNGTGQQWSGGDFNYDGTVNLTDFTFLAANFNTTVPAPSASRAAALAGAPGAIVDVRDPSNTSGVQSAVPLVSASVRVTLTEPTFARPDSGGLLAAAGLSFVDVQGSE